MCGRFAQISPAQRYAELLGIETGIETKPRYNVAPSTDILACRISPEGRKELVPLHWGLVPSWSKGPDPKYSMINARAETVAFKPAYRGSFRHKRCLIPADGFYEWHSEEGKKQPYYIHRKDDEPLVFAGLWDDWEKDGQVIISCSIIVCEANDFMKPIHDRMPVILHPKVFDEWLTSHHSQNLLELMVPYTGTDIKMYKVSRDVNNPKNDTESLIKAL